MSPELELELEADLNNLRLLFSSFKREQGKRYPIELKKSFIRFMDKYENTGFLPNGQWTSRHSVVKYIDIGYQSALSWTNNKETILRQTFNKTFDGIEYFKEPQMDFGLALIVLGITKEEYNKGRQNVL